MDESMVFKGRKIKERRLRYAFGHTVVHSVLLILVSSQASTWPRQHREKEFRDALSSPSVVERLRRRSVLDCEKCRTGDSEFLTASIERARTDRATSHQYMSHHT